MARISANQSISAAKTSKFGGIVHIVDSEKPLYTLCSIKCRILVKAEPDCIVCLDLLQYRLAKEL